MELKQELRQSQEPREVYLSGARVAYGWVCVSNGPVGLRWARHAAGAVDVTAEVVELSGSRFAWCVYWYGTAADDSSCQHRVTQGESATSLAALAAVDTWLAAHGYTVALPIEAPRT